MSSTRQLPFGYSTIIEKIHSNKQTKEGSVRSWLKHPTKPISHTDIHTWLFMATYLGWTGDVAALLKQADVNCILNDGTTLLSVAAEKNHAAIARLLLNAKIKPCSNALEIAIFNQHFEMAIILVHHFPTISNGAPLLAHTIRHHHFSACQALLNKQINVTEAIEDDGMTALHIAAQHASEAIMQLLLAYTTSANIYTTESLTPLHIAARAGNLATTHALIESGKASLNLVAKDGSTPLDLAKQSNHLEIAALIESSLTAYSVTLFDPLKKTVKNDPISHHKPAMS